MKKDERIIKKLIDERTLNESILKSYNWYWNTNESMLALFYTVDDYILDDSDDTYLCFTKEKYYHDDYITFDQDSISIVQGIGDDGYIRAEFNADIVIDEFKWRSIETTNYTLLYRRMYGINVLVYI